jgi:hypothetical protein
MNASIRIALLPICAMALVAAAPAQAQNGNGRWMNVSTSAEALDLGNGHTLTVFSARGGTASENSPMTGAGQCSGWVLTLPDGKTRMSYACARKSKDGHSWSDYGGIEPGADRGTWKMVGGTGVFAGKSRSGTWQETVNDGKTTVGTFTGNCP